MAVKKPIYTITDNGLEATTAGMQQLLNCSHVLISRFKKEGLLVQARPGIYDVPASIQVYHQHLKGKTPSGDIDFHEEKARLTKMQADKAEMDVGVMSGELVEVSEVVEEWQSQLMDMKGKLLAIPSKLATLVADMDNTAEIQDLIDNYMREALEELQDYDNESKRGHQGKPAKSQVGPKATTEAND